VGSRARAERPGVAAAGSLTLIPTENSYILARHLPNARVRIYADAGHGFLYQFPTEFADLIAKFLA
jgi:pimeloyl-ACP methyl ester carboxylesterase